MNQNVMSHQCITLECANFDCLQMTISIQEQEQFSYRLTVAWILHWWLDSYTKVTESTRGKCPL